MMSDSTNNMEFVGQLVELDKRILNKCSFRRFDYEYAVRRLRPVRMRNALRTLLMVFNTPTNRGFEGDGNVTMQELGSLDRLTP